MVAGYARVTRDSRVTRGTSVTIAARIENPHTNEIRTGTDVVASVPVRIRSYPPPCKAGTTIDFGGFSPTEVEVLELR